MKNMNRSVLIGAAFLMATSAIGSGFLTQTPVFTKTLLASFGFVILISILIDIGAQTNIWHPYHLIHVVDGHLYIDEWYSRAIK
ncbi:hypothetical protein I858_006590 [Planococcus versutus]|uniref:Uncharacterized protein n=2 Tax=Planococcus versutus TaxID=1302659 RepID=A0A1B1S0I1_9BACL|nr:hypothetical protein I858_006590 [Planococcus versutus]